MSSSQFSDAVPSIDDLAASVPSTASTGASSSATGDETSETIVVPLIEESLLIEKRRVDQGGWRVSKQVTTREETADEPLRSLQVTIERRAVDRLLASMEVPAPRQEGDTWILPVVEEVLVTEKRLRLKEEIRITRIDSVHHQPQQVQLRSEQVSIERLDPGHPLDISSR